MKRALLFAAGAVALSVPRWAAAQNMQEPAGAQNPPPACPPGQAPMLMPPPAYAPPPPPPPPAEQPRERRGADYSPGQTSFTIGGGVSDFVRDRISDQSSVAGTWDGRLFFGTRSYLGVEASYVGTAGSTEGALNGDTGHIIGTQVAGSLRLNATRKRIQPFLTAGAGWQHLSRSGSPEFGTIAIQDSDNSFVAPFGAGIAGYVGRHGVIDARGTYSLVTSKDFTTGGARPDMWGAELRFGYAF